MKKYSLLFSLIFMLGMSSCSSTNDDVSNNPNQKPKPLTQYQVDYYITKEDIEKYPLGYDNERTFVLEKTNNQALGNLGVIVHFANSVEKGYLAYDLCCPIHWEASDPLRHKLTLPDTYDSPFPDVYCNVKGYKSTFSLYWGVALNDSYAKRNNINLVKYRISQYPDIFSFEEEIGQHITNPYYKTN